MSHHYCYPLVTPLPARRQAEQPAVDDDREAGSATAQDVAPPRDLSPAAISAVSADR